jgi:N-acetylglucosamine kinase-like BadF-type ATPase
VSNGPAETGPLPTDWILGLDIGGSGSRAALQRLDAPAGEPLLTFAGARIEVGAAGIALPSILASLLPPVLHAVAGHGGQLRAAAVGMSGLLSLTAGTDDVHRTLRTQLGSIPVALASDAVTSLIGGLGLGGGAVVSAGTGVVGLGTDFARSWRRVDGWGHVLGDLGSGSWIGTAGLQAALAEHEGRAGGSAALLARLRHRWGTPEELPRQIYTRDDRAGILAAFAKDVADAAHDGDTVALDIWARAGALLADNLAAALGSEVPPLATYTGGLFDAGPLLLEPLAARFRAVCPDADLRAPLGGSLDGALTLARELLLTPSTFPDQEPYLTSRRGNS